jgi:hypothetical protein
MRINELLVESQQLDEGPFTQAVGKVGGKIAKGIANVGKDLKTGFKAGYSGEQPAADPAAATTAPAAAAAPTQAAPVKKAGGGVIDQLKKGFAQGQSEPAATAPSATAAPAATKNAAAPAATAAPAANPAAEKQSKIGVGQINKIIPTLRTRDLMSLKKNLDTVIAKKSTEKPAAAAPAADTAAPATPDANAPTAVGSKFTYGTVDGQPEVWTKTAKGWQSSVSGSTATGSYGKSLDQAYKQQSAKNKAPSQSEIDADREARIGPTSDSIIRTGPSLSETLARKVQEQKQRMFETSLVNGQHSIFKK